MECPLKHKKKDDTEEAVVMPYSAVILGASGSVGKVVVQYLLLSSACQKITTIGRRSLTEFEHEKIKQEVIEMDTLEERTAEIAAGHDVAFCTIGIGKPSSTSQEEIEKVEFGYVGAFARGCKKAGVKRFQIFTGVGADPESSINMVRVYGKKEQIVKGIGFQSLSIFRPSVILGNASTPGALNVIVPVINWALPSQYQGIKETDLAKAMVADVELNALEEDKLNVYEFKEMQKLITTWKVEL